MTALVVAQRSTNAAELRMSQGDHDAWNCETGPHCATRYKIFDVRTGFGPLEKNTLGLRMAIGSRG